MIKAVDLESLPLSSLIRLCNTGMFPVPMKEDGSYDPASSDRIWRWVRQGYKDER